MLGVLFKPVTKDEYEILDKKSIVDIYNAQDIFNNDIIKDCDSPDMQMKSVHIYTDEANVKRVYRSLCSRYSVFGYPISCSVILMANELDSKEYIVVLCESVREILNISTITFWLEKESDYIESLCIKGSDLDASFSKDKVNYHLCIVSYNNGFYTSYKVVLSNEDTGRKYPLAEFISVNSIIKYITEKIND